MYGIPQIEITPLDPGVDRTVAPFETGLCTEVDAGTLESGKNTDPNPSQTMHYWLICTPCATMDAGLSSLGEPMALTGNRRNLSSVDRQMGGTALSTSHQGEGGGSI